MLRSDWRLAGALGMVLSGCSGATLGGLDTEGGKPMSTDMNDGGGIVLDGAVMGDGSGGDSNLCMVRQIPTATIPAEIVLLADHSGSMGDIVSGNLTKWTEEKSGINGFASSPGAARQYGAMFVHPAVNVVDACSSSAYAQPSVGAATFSANHSKIATLLASLQPLDASPWSAVIKAGLEFAKTEQLAHADRRVATVFLADDLPTQCSTDITNQIVPIVSSYSEPMYVIGMSWYSSDQTGFDALAKAGKTEAAKFLMGTAITGAAIKTQLDTIRDQMGCDVGVPMDMGSPVDPTKYDFEVEYQNTRLKSSMVANAGACTSGPQHWVRDAKHVVLCPQACKMLDDAQTKVRFLSRCM